MAKTRNRIKEHRTVNAGTLLHNPKNWRRHPQAQQDALQGAINRWQDFTGEKAKLVNAG